MISTNFKECCQNCSDLSVDVVTRIRKQLEEEPKVNTEIFCRHQRICGNWRDACDSGRESDTAASDGETVS